MQFLSAAAAVRGRLPLLAMGLLAIFSGGAALAATTDSAPSPSPVESAATAAPGASSAEVTGIDGFRSAHFGMTAADVKSAIVTDFGVKPAAILSGENAAERTQLLSVAVPDVLPDGGIAQVSYVFGYKSKTLIQVGILWSHASDPTLTGDKLYADGDVLRSHFMSAGYKPDTVKTGLVLPSGLLLFRGEDAAGHATILILEGTFKPDPATKQQTLTPTGLALLYSQSPQNPDVFKIAPGQF